MNLNIDVIFEGFNLLVDPSPASFGIRAIARDKSSYLALHFILFHQLSPVYSYLPYNKKGHITLPPTSYIQVLYPTAYITCEYLDSRGVISDTELEEKRLRDT